MNCTTCHAENPHRAKFCVECGSAFVSRCAPCSADLPAGAKFCAECGTKVGSAKPAATPVPRETPKHLADKIRQSKAAVEGERKQVTVLFADLAGFTQLSACISGADLVRLLDELFTTFDLLAQRQGLEKIKTIGDAYMVVGGLPVPRADHARAVAELALDMVAAVRKQFSGGPHPVSIRIGISSGDHSGTRVITVATVPRGSLETTCSDITPITSNMVTGTCTCWVSCSEETIAPAAAYSAL
jgi:ribosomal protein L40E